MTSFMQYPNFWLGSILLVLIASQRFEGPHAPGYIRDRSDSRRYVLGLVVFTFATWIIYTIIWIIAWILNKRFEMIQGAVGISSILLVTFILPYLPRVANAFTKLRAFGHDLAGFPQDTDTLVLKFRRPAVNLNLPAVLDDAEESGNLLLSQVGKMFSMSCANSFYEATRIHGKISSLYADSDVTDTNSLLSERMSRVGIPSSYLSALRRYLARRREGMAGVESDYFNLLRRAARVEKLVNDHPLSERQLKQLSAFLADQAEDVVVQYQKLCAQIALAVFPAGEPRQQFLKFIDYKVSDPIPSLPLWPIFVVLAVEILPSILGFALTNDLFHESNVASDAGIIVAQGFAMTTAVFWAVASKAIWPWARPSLAGKPIFSYALFGLATYVCAVIFFAIVLSGFGVSLGNQQNRPPVLAMLFLPPGLFAVSNIILSWRIDRRIVKSSYQYGRAAVRDSLSLLLGTILFTLFFRGTMFVVFGVPWAKLPDIRLIWTVLGVSALVIGYAIPAWAVAYIYPKNVERRWH
jgi:hypothetical protein